MIGQEGVLAGSTRLLVTHNPGVLQYMDSILVMSEGRVLEQGTYKDLVARGALGELMQSKEDKGEGGQDKEGKSDGPLEEKEGDNARLTRDEEAQTGQVRWTVYLKYIRAIGLSVFCFNFFMYFLCEGIAAGANYVLAR